MARPVKNEVMLSLPQARRIWLAAQRLDVACPFGAGSIATRAAISHLGYVQIDTINVIERCHHHILYNRIPEYRRADLAHAQSIDKSVFEYWTHALSYVPAADLAYFLGEMRRQRQVPDRWFGSVTPAERRRIIGRIRREGPLSIRDIDDDELVDKDHPWASRKPSKRALQFAFFTGDLAVSGRDGMVKTYDLMDRHFGWAQRPKPASERQVCDYLLDRALRSQGIVSLGSACYMDAKRKPAVAALVAARCRRGELVEVRVDGIDKVPFWARPEALSTEPPATEPLVHILSPFDPLIIQRARLKALFGYEHRFEAYVPKEKRIYGYFALPVLIGDEIAAILDLKADRAGRRLLIQQWTWLQGQQSRSRKALVEAELHRFERFQLG